MPDTVRERVLITGAGGFVGSWMADEFARAWPDAALFGTTHEGHALSANETRIALMPCDITDDASVADAVRTADLTCVVHLAGMASGAGTDLDRLRRVNTNAALTLVRAVADRRKPCRVQLASSGYVYGPTQPGRPAREDDPLAPSGGYAESKVEMERLVREWRNDHRDSAVSLILARAFNHNGPRQTDSFVIPAFAKQIARIEAGREEPVVRVGNLAAKRDFLHVTDVVRAYRLLLESDVSNESVTTVNVASGQALSIRSPLDELIALSSTPVTVEADPARMRPVDLPECVGDPSKLTARTDWKMTKTISEMLAETLEWWRTQTV